MKRAMRCLRKTKSIHEKGVMVGNEGIDLQQILDNRLDVKQRGKEAIARTPGRDESVRLGVAVGWTKTLETESRARTESLTVWSGH